MLRVNIDVLDTAVQGRFDNSLKYISNSTILQFYMVAVRVSYVYMIKVTQNKFIFA